MKAELWSAVLGALAAALPLLWRLAVVLRQAVREKNWRVFLELVGDLMTAAEHNMMLESGAAKKAWVMESVAALSKRAAYPMDTEELSVLIDRLCAFAKEVNAGASQS